MRFSQAEKGIGFNRTRSNLVGFPSGSLLRRRYKGDADIAAVESGIAFCTIS